ncbi:MAG: hypothetical protein II779_11285, partial [Clostridia bacterium]|nr:hypothetical protein [Clostridia bacterium]
MKRICAALLAALMLALCACSNSEINTENSDAAAANDLSASEPETEPETTWIDTLPADVKYDGLTFLIGWSTPDPDSDECAPDIDEVTGDIVGESVHQRNLLAEEKLDISIASQKLTESWTTVLTDMKALILAGDTAYGAYDVGTWFMF